VELVLNKAKTLGSIADPVKASLPPPEYSSEKRLERASPTTKEGLASQDDFDTLYAWEQASCRCRKHCPFFKTWSRLVKPGNPPGPFAEWLHNLSAEG
jgi:hypothetical protein